jgi:hypothetical protein
MASVEVQITGLLSDAEGHAIGNELIKVIRQRFPLNAELGPRAWRVVYDGMEHTGPAGVFAGSAGEEWAVAYGCPSGDPNESAGIQVWRDEADAREHLQWMRDGILARRIVVTGRWEKVN